MNIIKYLRSLWKGFESRLIKKSFSLEVKKCATKIMARSCIGGLEPVPVFPLPHDYTCPQNNLWVLTLDKDVRLI